MLKWISLTKLPVNLENVAILLIKEKLSPAFLKKPKMAMPEEIIIDFLSPRKSRPGNPGTGR